MWNHGTIEVNGKRFYFCAKVYNEGSIYGIDEGRISKLEIRLNDKIVCNYDRGWDIKPTGKDAKEAYRQILQRFA